MIIYGKVPSKSNGYKIVTIAGHASLAKSKALKDYEKSFYMQCSERDRMIQGFFEIRLKVYFENMRPDLDGVFKVVLDMLQTCKVIKNDRNCVKIIAEKYVDKSNPRIEIEIIEI